MRNVTSQIAPRRRSRPSSVSAVVERLEGVPPWALVLELFLGLGWLRAAAEKLPSSSWWTGATIREFVSEHEAIGWYEPILDNVVLPFAVVVAFFVLVVQLSIGVAFITGRRVGFALGAASLLNLHFVAAGAVNPSAFYLMMQAALALWMVEASASRDLAGRLGLVSFVAGAVALLSSPYVMTLEPTTVIHDPAIMLVTLGSLAVLACEMLIRRLSA